MQVLGAVAVGMVGAFAAGMAVMVDKTLEAAVHTLHLAQSAGTTTEAISGLQFAAKMMGTDADAMALSMERLDKRLFGVTATAKLLAEAKDFGIDPEKIKTSDQALMILADRFVNLTDDAAKTAVAMDFFGKAGAVMIPILNLGSKGIQEFLDEAKALGIIMDTQTAKAAEHFTQDLTVLEAGFQGVKLAVVKDLIPNLNALTDSLVKNAKNSETHRVMIDVITTAFRVLASTIVLAIDAAADFGNSIKSTAAQVILNTREIVLAFEMVGAALTGNISAAKDFYAQLKQAHRDALEGMSEADQRAAAIAKETHDRLAAIWGKGTAAVSADVAALAHYAGTNTEAAKAAEKLAAAIDTALSPLITQTQTIGMTANETARWELAQKGADKATVELMRDLQSMTATQAAWAKVQAESIVLLNKARDDWYNAQQITLVKEMGDAITASIDALDKSTKTAGGQPDFISALGELPALIAPIHQQVRDIIKDLTEQNKNLGLTADQWVLIGLKANGASEAEIAAVHNAQAALLEHQQAVETLKDRWKEFGDVANRALDDLIFSGKKFTQVLQDIIKSLGEMFLKFALFGNGKSGSGGGLFGMLENGLKGLFGVGGGGGGGGIDPGLNLGLGFASGGPASAGVPILVGEQGPEIFTPSMSGTIIPNSSIAPMMRSSGGQAGGVTMIYNVDARGADAGAEARIRKALQDTENNAVARALLMVRDTQLRTA